MKGGRRQYDVPIHLDEDVGRDGEYRAAHVAIVLQKRMKLSHSYSFFHPFILPSSSLGGLLAWCGIFKGMLVFLTGMKPVNSESAR